MYKRQLQLRNPQRGISDVHSEVIDLNPVELLQGNLYRRVLIPQRENSLIPQKLRKNLVLQLAQLDVRLSKEVSTATCRIAQLVTMDTRPQCGAGPSNSFDTGYELGFPAAADVWRLACCTAEYLARHYPAGVRRGGEPVGISRARIDAGSRQMMRVAPLPVDDTACYSFLQVGRRPSALLVNYKAFSKLGVKSLVVV